MKITKEGIYWREWKYDTPEDKQKANEYANGDPYYQYECYFNWPYKLNKSVRGWGYDAILYDCQWHEIFSFGIIAIAWSTNVTSKRLWREHNG